MVTPTPAPAPAPAPQEGEPGKPRIDWKHKFSVLQGKYDAEVPRYARDLREARAENSDLKSKLLTLHDENNRLRQGTPAGTPAANDFDPAFLTLLEQATATAVSAKVKPLEERVQVAEQADNARRFEAFKASVNDYVVDATGADWLAIQNTPEFQTFMVEHDPASGLQRQELLNAAITRGDPMRAAYFYIESFNRNKPVSAPAPVAATPDPRTHLVTPTQTASSAVPASGAPKRMYTNAEVTTFYTNVAKKIGSAVSSEERARTEAMQRDIDLAYAEGRIKG